MAAPKGTKLASGYRDRTRDRADDDADDREARIKALEEQMKLGQIEREVFEQLRDNITGGEIGATHLVKGLDRQLLQRIRRGEDVLKEAEDNAKEENEDQEPELDADEELDKLEEKEIAPVEREKATKKGEMAPPPLPIAGVKRSRNDILAELKASRKAAAEAEAAAQPILGSKFKKVGVKKPSSKIEIDERGREVLITVDEDGHVKRKVRKVAKGNQTRDLPMPDKSSTPLGIEAPLLPPAKSTTVPDLEDDDIFEGVGDFYNPLGDVDDEVSSSDEEATSPRQLEAPKSIPAGDQPPALSGSTPPPPAKRNYFNETHSKTSSPPPSRAPFADPAILAAIKHASLIASRSEALHDTSTVTQAQSAIAQRLLAQQDRDYDDMDMGFGGSRFEDAEEMDEGGAKVKLSKWKGVVNGEDDGEEAEVKKGKGKERKRGAKKRTGDKDSAADVLRVIEGRKGK